MLNAPRKSDEYLNEWNSRVIIRIMKSRVQKLVSDFGKVMSYVLLISYVDRVQKRIKKQTEVVPDKF